MICEQCWNIVCRILEQQWGGLMRKPRVSDEELASWQGIAKGIASRAEQYDMDDDKARLVLDLQEAREELKSAVEHMEQAFGRNQTDTWWAVWKKKYGMKGAT